MTLNDIFESLKLNRLEPEQFEFLVDKITAAMKSLRSYSIKARSVEEREEIVSKTLERLLRTFQKKDYQVEKPEALLQLIVSQVINSEDRDITNHSYINFRRIVKEQLENLEKEGFLVSNINSWISSEFLTPEQFNEQLFNSKMNNIDYTSFNSGINFSPKRKEELKNILKKIFAEINFAVNINDLTIKLAENLGYSILYSFNIPNEIDEEDDAAPFEIKADILTLRKKQYFTMLLLY